jgi:ZIP family zinc transporter
MIEWLERFDPVSQALLATLFTWVLTALGALPVLFTRRFHQQVMDGMLGFAAGVMIAASYWSLLAPAIELSGWDWKPATLGFLGGGLSLYLLDRVLPHLHPGEPSEKAEGPKTSWRRSVLLVLAITLHNIPEGLAVGVAFGGAAAGLPGATLGGAVALALGIGLQNMPEGLAVAMPLRREGVGRARAFLVGQASGIVEPIDGVLGAVAVLSASAILPYALAFAAWAMIFVCLEELIPESQRNGFTDFATLGGLLGFALMMSLDVGLG